MSRKEQLLLAGCQQAPTGARFAPSSSLGARARPQGGKVAGLAAPEAQTVAGTGRGPPQTPPYPTAAKGRTPRASRSPSSMSLSAGVPPQPSPALRSGGVSFCRGLSPSEGRAQEGWFKPAEASNGLRFPKRRLEAHLSRKEHPIACGLPSSPNTGGLRPPRHGGGTREGTSILA